MFETKGMKTTKKVSKSEMIATMNKGLKEDIKSSDRPKVRVIDTYRPTTCHGGNKKQTSKRNRKEGKRICANY